MSLMRLTDIEVRRASHCILQDVSLEVPVGARIAVLGDNGSGKSTLLRLMAGDIEATHGVVERANHGRIGYVQQILDEGDGRSGGERVSEAIGSALSQHPDILLLDEPTNHLDRSNRRRLLRTLDHFDGALVIVSHDVELIDRVCSQLWIVRSGSVSVFNGAYSDYRAQKELERSGVEQQLTQLRRLKAEAHDDLMREQNRAATSRKRGIKHIEQRKWATVRSAAKLDRGATTAGTKRAQISERQEQLSDALAGLDRDVRILPTFGLPSAGARQGTILQITDGAVRYEDDPTPVIEGLFLRIQDDERVALIGPNGSGKSTIIKAIVRGPGIVPGGAWILPKIGEIGVIDQHYSGLDATHTPLEALAALKLGWSAERMRTHLADFLFRGASSIDRRVSELSGGERARLCLACVAARPPSLLILDEVTNNLDLTTKAHVQDILEDYPGAMLVISHSDDFLTSLNPTTTIDCASLHR